MAVVGSLPGSGAPAPARSLRPLLLGGIAALLTALTIWDYSGPAERTAPRRDLVEADATVPVPVQGSSAGASHASNVGPDPISEAARLRHFLARAKLIRQRYHTIAVPYAEAVAGIAALHPPAQTARGAAEYAVRSFIPEGVELKEILLAEGASRVPGVVNIRATVSLASSDSQSFIKTLLALGESANGMLWTSFSIAVDGSGRHLLAKGDLNILTVEQAE